MLDISSVLLIDSNYWNLVYCESKLSSVFTLIPYVTLCHFCHSSKYLCGCRRIFFLFSIIFFFFVLCWFFVLWIAIPTIDRIFVQNPKIFWRRRQAIVIAKCVRLSKKYCHFCEKTIAFPKERQTTLNSSTHKISTNNYTIYNIGTSIGECVNVVPVQLNNGMLENRLGPFFRCF